MTVTMNFKAVSRECFIGDNKTSLKMFYEIITENPKTHLLNFSDFVQQN